MPVWLDENTIEGEMSQEEFVKQVTKTMTTRVEQVRRGERRLDDYTNNGFIPVYSEHKVYNGVSYKLIVLRFFVVTGGPDGPFELKPEVAMNKIGKHVIVEADARPSYGLRTFLSLDEFLWFDTLRSGQEEWSLRQQWEYADKVAIFDCERVSDLLAEFNTRITELRKEFEDFTNNLKGGN